LNGDLVLSRWNGQVVWKVATNGDLCQMRKGALVVTRNRQIVWSSMTSNHPGSRLALQNDGDLCIYSKNGTDKLWSTHTAFSKIRSKDTFVCNRRLEDYQESLMMFWKSRSYTSRPLIGNGEKLLHDIRLRIGSEWMTESVRSFEELRVLEPWDLFAFRETWTDLDTEELQRLDGGSGIFVKGPLTTESIAARLPSIEDLRMLFEKRQIAIVGSGKSVVGHGHDIDRHSVIVRFNHLVGDLLTPEDTGVVTNIHVGNAHIPRSLGPEVAFFDLETTSAWKSHCTRMTLDKNLSNTFLFRPSALCAISRASGFSRGFLFYWLVGSYFEEINIYGMGMTDGRAHYGPGTVFEDNIVFEHFFYSEVARWSNGTMRIW